ncbi:hypothetical protein TSAR_004737 [Trichomalopsis sarcophagae]|uniref:Uncharacterized protein n=1 Tax=Trichomalopsis sarcophagae TaxID=543379 RepID=A0A232FFA4_9HYME|nr:hypothetical protein TSAR_004737 [Trichomalopsis sarcophagae]
MKLLKSKSNLPFYLAHKNKDIRDETVIAMKAHQKRKMKFQTFWISQHVFNLALFTLISTCDASKNCQESITRSFSKNYTIQHGPEVFVSYSVLLPSVNETANDDLHYVTCERLNSNIHEDILFEKVHLIDMTKCTNILNFTIHPKFDDSAKFMLWYKNAIEFGFTDEKHCNGLPSCKILYDFDGKQIGGTEPLRLQDPILRSMSRLVFPVSQHNPGKGYYVNERSAVYYVDSFGKGKKQLANFTEGFSNIIRMTVSCAHELYTLCAQYKNKNAVQCIQFDTEKLKTNVTIKVPNTTKWLAVRDLSDGGFVLVTGSCTSVDDASMEDGQMYKALDIDELELVTTPFSYQVMISENDNDELCIFWVWIDAYHDYEFRIFNKWCILKKHAFIRD